MSEKKILYLECNAGISGDMTVASLLDLGADEEVLKNVIQSIPVSGFEVKIGRVKKAGLDVCDFDVRLDAEHENHDHDMEYLHGDLPEEDHHHHHEEEHHHHEEGHHHHEEGHHHHHEEGHHHHEEEGHHHHAHRSLPEILDIIERTEMTEKARALAVRIFKILARAEAKAHGVSEKEVHFHEVGAVDSIVDVIAAAVCLDNLGIERCVVPKLCEGTGTVRCQHGVMSVPVPAVLNIVQDNNLRLSITDMQGEFVTPTGAAIAAAVKTEDALPKEFRIIKTGMGAGKRTYERPSILRAMLLEEETSADFKSDTDVIYKLETNLDDCSGEALGYVMERLFEAGARDVHYMPVYMKKNRPAYQLDVICDKERVPVLEDIIFRETTTIGIRRQEMERCVLLRRIETVQTLFGEARVKVCHLPEKRYYPEYESVSALCRQTGKPYQEVFHLIVETCERRNL